MKKNKMPKILVALLIISIGVTGCTTAKKDAAKVVIDKSKESGGIMMNVGKKAPDFELKDTSGKVHKLSDYGGKKVYIKFWASWCSICLAGLDEVDTLASKENDFIVLSVVAPSFRGEMKSEEFIKWFKGLGKDNLTVLLDEKGSISNEFEVRGYPTSAFIGSDGVAQKIQPGQKSNEEIQKIFETIK